MPALLAFELRLLDLMSPNHPTGSAGERSALVPSPTTTAPVAPWALPVPVCTAPAAPRWEVYCPDGKVRLDVAATVPAARAAARRCGCRWGAAGHLAFDLSADPMVESSGVRL